MVDEPEPPLNPSEIQVGIDMEIEVGTPELIESESSTPVLTGSSETRSPAVERIEDRVPDSDSEDGLMTEYQTVTQDLLQHLPSVRFSICHKFGCYQCKAEHTA